MYKRILLAYDGSESGRKALLDGVDIVQWSHAELYLIAVMPRLAPVVIGIEGGIYASADDEEAPQKYRAILDDGLAQIAASGIDARGEVLVGESVEEITRYARQEGLRTIAEALAEVARGVDSRFAPGDGLRRRAAE